MTSSNKIADPDALQSQVTRIENLRRSLGSLDVMWQGPAADAYNELRRDFVSRFERVASTYSELVDSRRRRLWALKSAWRSANLTHDDPPYWGLR